MKPLFSFDTGLREQIDENTTWHGHGWFNADGSIRFPVGPDTSMLVENTGSVKVYHERERVW